MNQIKHLIISFLTAISIIAVVFIVSFIIIAITNAIGALATFLCAAFIILWAFLYIIAENM